MAINQKDKALSIARRLVALAEQQMILMDAATALKNEKESSGIDLTTYNTDFSVSDLKHVDGTSLNNAITSFAAFKTWAEAGFYDDTWQALRR